MLMKKPKTAGSVEISNPISIDPFPPDVNIVKFVTNWDGSSSLANRRAN